MSPLKGYFFWLVALIHFFPSWSFIPLRYFLPTFFLELPTLAELNDSVGYRMIPLRKQDTELDENELRWILLASLAE